MDNLEISGTVYNDGEEVDLFQGLNPEQKKAVCHNEGPLLILAGAGSGKTRVITYRIAYLIRVRHIQPSSILAITFTNKAANEMKERIFRIVGNTAAYMWVGTFHSMFARILRRHAEMLGYTKHFSITDSDDQLKIVKECIKELDLNDKIFIPRSVLGEISRAKNDMLSVEQYLEEAGPEYRKQKIATVYRKYQDKLLRSNSMDFDDILFNAVELFSRNPDVLRYYQEQFRYILVDEYQDTNHAQYRLILQLAKKFKNLCVVGDDDQSIYSFRGANIRNILDFEKDFKNTVVIKLEQNYRSTKTILQAANSVISHNSKRKKKALHTELENGDKVVHFCADHHGAEAYYVAEQIHRLTAGGQYKFGEIAVLYRMNALSRTVEAALREQGIPYRVLGGQRFYERKEIKDVIAYLRLIMSSSDEYAFTRIVNVPRRGIGDTTVERIRSIAHELNITCLEVCSKASVYPELSRQTGRLEEFAVMIGDFREKLAENSMIFSEFIEYVQDQSGMVQEILENREKKGETVDRVENLRELLSEAVEFEARRKNPMQVAYSADQSTVLETDPYASEDTVFEKDLTGILQAYLENAALYSEGDNDQMSDDYVRLLTIHSAKGLEFGVVFLVGVEEGIFPGVRSMGSADDIEEERRLMYVAITRAKRKLIMITSRSRILFGQTQAMPASRFIREIDPKYVECIGTRRKTLEAEGYSRNAYGRGNDSGRFGSAGFSSGYYSSNSAGSNRAKAVAPGSSSGDETGTGYLKPDDISKGFSVFHPRFGNGTVVSVEKVAGDALVCVTFDNKSTKNMLLKQAKLTRPDGQ